MPAAVRFAYNDAVESGTHVREVGGEGEDAQDLRDNADVKVGGARRSLHGG